MSKGKEKVVLIQCGFCGKNQQSFMEPMNPNKKIECSKCRRKVEVQKSIINKLKIL